MAGELLKPTVRGKDGYRFFGAKAVARALAFVIPRLAEKRRSRRIAGA